MERIQKKSIKKYLINSKIKKKKIMFTLYKLRILDKRWFNFLWFWMLLMTMSTSWTWNWCSVWIQLCKFKWFGSRTSSCIYNMSPIAQCTGRKFFPSFDQKNASIANLSWPFFTNSETFFKFWFIFFRISESWTWWFSFANTATRKWTIYFRLMKAEHGFEEYSNNNSNNNNNNNKDENDPIYQKWKSRDMIKSNKVK